MRFKNRRRGSSVLVPLMVIFLTIIIFSLIFTIMITLFISKSSTSLNLSPKLSCLELQLNEIIKIKEIKYNEEYSEIEITLEYIGMEYLEENENKDKLTGEEIKEIEFTFLTSSSKEEFFCSRNCQNCKLLKKGETRTYRFKINEKPQSIILKVNKCLIEKIEKIN